MVGHPRCVFINYIWLNQLSNTTNLWWIGVYYLVINYMFRRLSKLTRACTVATLGEKVTLLSPTLLRNRWCGYPRLHCSVDRSSSKRGLSSFSDNIRHRKIRCSIRLRIMLSVTVMIQIPDYYDHCYVMTDMAMIMRAVLVVLIKMVRMTEI